MKTLNLHKTGILTVALGIGLAGVAQAQSAPRIFLDGHPFRTAAEPFTQDGRVLVPMRAIFEGMGADVRFNDADQTITARRDHTVVRMTLGSPRAHVDGAPVSLDVPATAYAGRTFVPLRFVSEALGAQVNYNSFHNVVTISDDGPGPDRDHHDGPGDRIHDDVDRVHEDHTHNGHIGDDHKDDGRLHIN